VFAVPYLLTALLLVAVRPVTARVVAEPPAVRD
jgi:hypothetical protein